MAHPKQKNIWSDTSMMGSCGATVLRSFLLLTFLSCAASISKGQAPLRELELVSSGSVGELRTADQAAPVVSPPLGQSVTPNFNRPNVQPGTKTTTTGQLLLNRRSPQVVQPPTPLTSQTLQLVQPSGPGSTVQDPVAETRPVASSMLQQSLPAAAVPARLPEYTTSSPYQLRSLPSADGVLPNQNLRAIPVSMTRNSEDEPTAPAAVFEAPKVARKPRPKPVSAPPSQPSTPLAPEFIPASPSGTPTPIASVPSLEALPSPTVQSQPTPQRPDELPDPPALSGLPPLPQVGSLPAPTFTPTVSQAPNATAQSSPAQSSPAPQRTTLPPANPTAPSFTIPQTQAAQQANTAGQGDFTPTSKVLNPSESSGLSAGRTGLPPRATPPADERLRMQTPRITVTLNGPAELALGESNLFRVQVRNEDKFELAGIILRLDIPPGVLVQTENASTGRVDAEQAQDGTTLLTWTFEHLPGGAEAFVPLRVRAEQPKNFNVAMEWTLLPMAATADIDVLTPRLELALEGPSEVNFSETNIYRLRVRNRGNADASDVSVKLAAEHFGSSSTQIGRIAAGAEQTLDVELVFNEPGSIQIGAEASTAGNVAAASQVNVRVRQSVLEASIEAPEVVFHSSPTPYVLRIHNAGDAVANDARAVVSLPTDCTALSLPPQAKLENGSIVWDATAIRPGQTAELSFQLSFAREGDNQVSVQCSSRTAVPVQCVAVTQVKAVSDLKLLVIDPVAPAPVHGEVEYELRLVNRGSKAAQQVSVVAMFSKDIEPTRGEGQRAEVLSGQIRFQPITRIEPGQTVTLRVFALASAAGMHRFRAEVRSADADIKLVQEQSTEYMETVRRMATSTSSQPVVR